MKALIISNDDNVISSSKKLLETNGFDLIVYKWLLKALDNIEEIHPDLIFVSAFEYPRHWKTLVQFVKSGIGGDKVAVFLYAENGLSSDDEEKAKALGINGLLKDFSDEQIADFESTVKSFFNLGDSYKKTEKEILDITFAVPDSQDINSSLTMNSDSAEADEVESESEEKSGSVMFTNPETQEVNTGKVLSFNHKKLECVFDYDFTELSNNDKIKNVTYFDGKQVLSFSAEIFILNRQKNSAILTVQEQYEEI